MQKENGRRAARLVLLTGQTYEEIPWIRLDKCSTPDDNQPTIDAWNEAVKACKIFILNIV
jgi:hypothetical protein